MTEKEKAIVRLRDKIVKQAKGQHPVVLANARALMDMAAGIGGTKEDALGWLRLISDSVRNSTADTTMPSRTAMRPCTSRFAFHETFLMFYC
jgi:hypothetical protein